MTKHWSFWTGSTPETNITIKSLWSGIYDSIHKVETPKEKQIDAPRTELKKPIKFPNESGLKSSNRILFVWKQLITKTVQRTSGRPSKSWLTRNTARSLLKMWMPQFSIATMRIFPGTPTTPNHFWNRRLYKDYQHSVNTASSNYSIGSSLRPQDSTNFQRGFWDWEPLFLPNCSPIYSTNRYKKA